MTVRMLLILKWLFFMVCSTLLIWFLQQGPQELFSRPRLTRGSIPWMFETYQRAWKSLCQKIDTLQEHETIQRKLVQENVALKREIESLKLHRSEFQAEQKTHDIESKLTQMAGSAVGLVHESFTNSSIPPYTVTQLYSLGLYYLESRENEKSAQILTYVLSQPGNSDLQTPTNWFATGLAWYRLKNFIQSEIFFDKVLKQNHSLDHSLEPRLEAQAKIFKALIAHQTGKELKAQYWLQDLFDRFPRSPETNLINRWQNTKAH